MVDLDALKAVAVAKSPQAAADEMAELFEILDDRDAKNQYMLELGEKLLPMPAGLKSERTRVHGCMSVVHLFGRKRRGTDGHAGVPRGLRRAHRARADRRAASGSSRAAGGGDPGVRHRGFFRRIGLEQFITVQRRNGLAGMVARIRALASEIVS